TAMSAIHAAPSASVRPAATMDGLGTPTTSKASPPARVTPSSRGCPSSAAVSTMVVFAALSACKSWLSIRPPSVAVGGWRARTEPGQQRAAALAAAHLREAREQLERLLRLGQRALVRIGGQARELEGVLAGRGGELAALLGGKVEHEDQGGQHCQADDGEEVPADTDDAPRHDSRANRKKRTRVGPAGRRGASARGRWRPRPGHDSVTSKR